MRGRVVYVVCAEGEEALADQLAAPLKHAGYEVAHNGTIAIGESRLAEAEKAIASGSPIVLCATARAIGSAWSHRIINAAHSGNPVRVFVVQMERQAYVEPLALDGRIARYCDDPAQAIRALVEALAKNYPPAERRVNGEHETQAEEDTSFLDHPVDSATIDISALEQFRSELREEFAARYPSEITLWEFLGREGLWTSGKLTRTGALLFATNSTAACLAAMVKCAHYSGTDRAASRDIATFDGTVPSQIVAARQFVADRVSSGEAPSDDSAQLTKVYDYPMVAVREIIANALVHRDYETAKACVHVRLFTDRLEVSSPGTWAGRDLDPKMQYNLSALVGQSIKRNYRLAHILSYIKLVEGEGSGLPAALRSCQAINSPMPTVLQEDGFVTVILRPRERDSSNATSFGQLLIRARTRARLTQEELASSAGVSPRSVGDLERGINLIARRETARLLADALNLYGPAREEFEAAARGARVALGSATPGASHFGGAAATRTLPRDIASFTGREFEFNQLVEATSAGSEAPRSGSGVVAEVCAIGGMAGVGKTAFAIHAAHRLADQYPDGQIFLSLLGHAPGQQPVTAGDALATLLQSTGVAAQMVPAGLEARARLWRDYLAGRRYLIVLDDALGSEQVRPLLPGTAGSLVLVTSRRHLTALEDARMISLDIPPAADAAQMLARLAGRSDLEPEDPAVVRLIELCGCLPLAIGMAASQLRHHPVWTVNDLAADLARSRDRLDLLSAGNLSVSAAFDMSNRDLDADQQRLLTFIGLHPGADIDAYAAAALLDVDLGVARHLLDDLYDHYLLAEPARGRYRPHDLIREHTKALADAGPPAEGAAALMRLLNYYLHTALTAGRHLAWRIPAGVPEINPDLPRSPPDLSALRDAVSWMSTERSNLHLATAYAGRHGLPAYATAIPAAMHGFLRGQGYWDQAQSLYQGALEAARATADQLAEASALTDLGDIESLTGDHASATDSLTRALDIYQAAANQLGEANALHNLGTVQQRTGDLAAARVTLSRALTLQRAAGNSLGEASVLNSLGSAQYRSGDYAAAITSLARALELQLALGNQLGEANALNELGIAKSLTGQHTAAITDLTKALELHRALGNKLGEANATRDLGRAQHASGDNKAATASLTTALAMHRALGNKLGEANTTRDLERAKPKAPNHERRPANQ
jgi:tetratricopeptide (TPR) repeat protein/transcriptional regulator with XRE-family HTH domain